MRGGAGSLRSAALELLSELLASRLEVVLIPADDPRHTGHKIRVVAEANCEWYRDFCDEYRSARRRRSRKTDTAIRRRETRRALERIAAGESAGVYEERLAPYLRARAKEIAEALAFDECEEFFLGVQSAGGERGAVEEAAS